MASEEPMTEREECSGGFQLTSLMKAALHGQAELVATALECTATNLDAIGGDGRTALITAAGNGHLGVVKALMAAGCELDVTDLSGLTAAQVAEAAGHVGIADAIKKEQAHRTAIWAAISGEAPKGGALPILTNTMMSSAKGGTECPF
mmetsp:Transcript_31747/g.38341  ORF Transcript_31747/g.38341 Transcript_31747/m.38341 type:complete len:148 (-) Transcript_31747:126-569(-)|eukprot:CAMPEP_0197852592 /NCGR_PEP_ID=MMETSP1438-20131217/20984_1 /TAXON_ID=1461541 /ORGANISM="Pterosperma sp., Strain CCMP1384" /LENGTH=147 /DNA_ID=CAMNT_0043466715 /DNA_START=213 /DNA_END=656 /DNA_ORIENTATION=-